MHGSTLRSMSPRLRLWASDADLGEAVWADELRVTRARARASANQYHREGTPLPPCCWSKLLMSSDLRISPLAKSRKDTGFKYLHFQDFSGHELNSWIQRIYTENLEPKGVMALG